MSGGYQRRAHLWQGETEGEHQRGRGPCTRGGGLHGREQRREGNGDLILTWPDVLTQGPSRGIPHRLPFLPQGVWKCPLSVLALDNEVEAPIKSATKRPERSKA
jgi:hypothetical protein